MAEEKKEKPKYPKRQVVAKQDGFASGDYRKKGDKFEFSGAPAHWLEEPSAGKAEEKGEEKQPEAKPEKKPKKDEK